MYRHKAGSRQLVIAVVLSLLAGCAALQKTPAPRVGPTEVAGQVEPRSGWWYVRFKINWPDGVEPSWYMDPLLANEVAAPALQEFEPQILLWRFHRRASRDRAGHQFSLIFYAPAETARALYGRIGSNERLKLLKKAGAVVRDSYDKTDRVARPAVEDTSDPSWSPDLQKSWPYFIMGVSRTWLRLIQLKAAEAGRNKDPSTFGELKEKYSLVNEAIDRLWQREGGHAFLHHLNALFGYVPVQFQEKRILSF